MAHLMHTRLPRPASTCLHISLLIRACLPPCLPEPACLAEPAYLPADLSLYNEVVKLSCGKYRDMFCP